MQQSLQITFKNFTPSDAVEQVVRKKVHKLEQFCDHIVGCHVVLEMEHHRHRKGNHFAVRLDIQVPGGELAVTAPHHDDPAHADIYVAVRDAFDAAQRQLQDYMNVRRES